MFLKTMSKTLAAALLLIATVCPDTAHAQTPAVPSAHPAVREALQAVVGREDQLIQEQIELCEIPAPPFGEALRGAEYARRMREIGLQNVRTDAEGNVLGELPGSGDGPLVVLSGHLDTVFPEGTDVTVTVDGDMLAGPGISDDCRGLAVVLGVAKAIVDAGIETTGTLVFVGTVGEEGQGDLRGVRHLFETELRDRVDYFISVDGSGLGITKDGVGSNRYRVSFTGPGGHSYGAFGMPNPIHALGRAIEKISEFRVPDQPKTTFSVGRIEGGTSVNSISFEASMEVDMRSEAPASLARVDSLFHSALQDALEEERRRWNSDVPLEMAVEVIGIRPAGSQASEAAIVVAGVESAAVFGFQPELRSSSTDANVPISLGIPAVTIGGGGRGEGSHSLGETFNRRDSQLGTQWVLLYTLTLAGVQ